MLEKIDCEEIVLNQTHFLVFAQSKEGEIAIFRVDQSFSEIKFLNYTQHHDLITFMKVATNNFSWVQIGENFDIASNKFIKRNEIGFFYHNEDTSKIMIGTPFNEGFDFRALEIPQKYKIQQVCCLKYFQVKNKEKNFHAMIIVEETGSIYSKCSNCRDLVY